MTRTDRKILFTALAFFAVLAKGRDANSAEEAEQIRQLAALAENFCARNAGGMYGTTANEADDRSLDAMIVRLVGDLRDKEVAHLPEDRAALSNLHDRLVQRKSRRTYREFYALATEAQFADEVLRLLDEEIEDASRAKLA